EGAVCDPQVLQSQSPPGMIEGDGRLLGSIEGGAKVLALLPESFPSTCRGVRALPRDPVKAVEHGAKFAMAELEWGRGQKQHSLKHAAERPPRNLFGVFLGVA